METTKATRERLTIKFVDGALTKFKAGSPRKRLWDTEVGGFHLQITPAGTGSYVLKYTMPKSGKVGWETIGRVDKVSLEDARHAAKRFLSQVTLGQLDPAEDKRPKLKASGPTVTHLAKDYFELRKVETSESCFEDEHYSFFHYLAPVLGKHHFDKLTMAEVKAALRSIQRAIQHRNTPTDPTHTGYRRLIELTRCFGRFSPGRWRPRSPSEIQLSFDRFSQTKGRSGWVS